MKKQAFLLLGAVILLLSFLTSCTHDENRVYGVVSYIDITDNQEYVKAGISVYLMPEGETDIKNAVDATETDENGIYEFDLIEDGSYYVHAEFYSLLDLRTYRGDSEVFKLRGKTNKEVNVVLK